MTMHTSAQLSLGRARGARRNPESRYCIEGETLTLGEIATRLGVSTSATKARLAKLRHGEGAVTWEALGLKRG